MAVSNGIIVNAKDLRTKDNLIKIPRTSPGYYKWWATYDSLLVLLSRLHLDFDAIADFLETKNGLFCIYIGIAVKESIRDRLDWHINQINIERNVKNGTLSTFRQTISSLVGKNMLDNQATNDYIDKLVVEYFVGDYSIKSQEATVELHGIERGLLSSPYLYLLNIQENKHPLSPKKTIKSMRKSARAI